MCDLLRTINKMDLYLLGGHRLISIGIPIINWKWHKWLEVVVALALGYFPGGRLNKKDGLTRYGDSHVKDKTS